MTDSNQPGTSSKFRGILEVEKAKEAYKARLWKNRVAFVRKGNLCMKNKIYSDAAVSYEKYLKILEMLYECGPNGLTPEMLKDSARTTELSVISTVYWDLLRIYDSSDNYTHRQKVAADKLAKFALYTPLFVDILKKAQQFQRVARHPEVVKSFISKTKKNKTKCFIATEAFEYPMANEVQFLRRFRDETLYHNVHGRKFICWYYQHSPRIANFLSQNPSLKPVVRFSLRAIIFLIK